VGRRDWCQAVRAALIYAECRYSEKRADRFFAHTARGHLARADSLAECVGTLWAICFREGSERVDRQSRLVGRIQIKTAQRMMSEVEYFNSNLPLPRVSPPVPSDFST